ncbi:hypothetical protein KC330_g51 [Hortaea werneckii]|nr:hypothetical protein KC330_g51 [Hortaea werneckii]
MYEPSQSQIALMPWPRLLNPEWDELDRLLPNAIESTGERQIQQDGTTNKSSHPMQYIVVVKSVPIAEA